MASLEPLDPQNPEFHGEESLLEDDHKQKKRKKNQRDGSTLRKCPTAPKRFKSSYICFFMDKQPVIKEELGDNATVTEVSKRSAEMWKSLSAEERAHWDDVAAKDKQRYMVEKATYTGPWQVPWKRVKKDPSAPKRPMSAFLYFSQDRRRTIKDKNPTLKNTEVSRILGELWRNASDLEKKPHVDREKSERESYKVDIAEWREEFGKKVEEQKKLQAEQSAYVASMYRHEGGAYQYPQHVPYDPNMINSQYMIPPYGYAMPPDYLYAYPPVHSAARYGYANGKHVAVLGPNGMPASYYTPQQSAGDEEQEGYGHSSAFENPTDNGQQQSQMGQTSE